MTDSIKSVLDRALGTWSGREEVVIEPQSSESVVSTGRFQTTKALLERGMRSSYIQEINDAQSLACESVYRFMPDGGAIMVWVPSDGPPQVFSGQLSGDCIKVSREDEDGTLHKLHTDYAVIGTMTNTMTICPVGSESIVVFSGHYKRESS